MTIYPDINNLKESSDKIITDDMYFNYLNTIYKCNIHDMIIINLTTYRYYIPKELLNTIKKCKDNLIVLSFRLVNFYYNTNKNNKIGHTNVCIYNRKLNMIEFFEPYGDKYENYLNFDIKPLTHYIVNSLFDVKKSIFKNIHNNNGLQYIQSKYNPNCGHCSAWCLLFIELRLSNRDKDIKNIIDVFLKKHPKDVNSYIKKYITFIKYKKRVTRMKRFDEKNYNISRININKINIKKRINELFVTLYNTRNKQIKEKTKYELQSFVVNFNDDFVSECVKYKYHNINCNDKNI